MTGHWSLGYWSTLSRRVCVDLTYGEADFCLWPLT